MIVARHSSTLKVSAETYTLTLPPDRPFIYVDDAYGTRLMDLFALGSVHPLHTRDDTDGVAQWQITRTTDQILCSLHAQSSAWDQKIYWLRCCPQRFGYEIEVHGTAQLADVLDMICFNDTLEWKRRINPAIGWDIGAQMAHRAKIAALACPHALIDTDNWPMLDRTAWRAYTQWQPDLGVPALYFVDRIDLTQEPLEAEDYDLVRDTWARWRAQGTDAPQA